MDHISQKERSALMSKIKGKNTTPEIKIRLYLWGKGLRYRLHRKNLPGTPDITFPSQNKVIFVHGCFWHGHKCRKSKLPKTRTDFWKEKIMRNKKRDTANRRALKKLGVESFVIWECQVEHEKALKRLMSFLAD
ncbi:MAG: very short patch repair endonuclease [Nitrospinota bacterium]|nr:very short patch repair endonuclease [Nitrospinota bacterium]